MPRGLTRVSPGMYRNASGGMVGQGGRALRGFNSAPPRVQPPAPAPQPAQAAPQPQPLQQRPQMDWSQMPREFPPFQGGGGAGWGGQLPGQFGGSYGGIAGGIYGQKPDLGQQPQPGPGPDQDQMAKQRMEAIWGSRPGGTGGTAVGGFASAMLPKNRQQAGGGYGPMGGQSPMLPPNWKQNVQPL